MKKLFAIALTAGVLALSLPYTSSNAGTRHNYSTSVHSPIVMCGYRC